MQTNSLQTKLRWLQEVVRTLLQKKIGGSKTTAGGELILYGTDSAQPDAFDRFVSANNLPPAEIVTLLLALAAHIKPDIFDNLFSELLPKPGDFPQLGGVRSQNSRVFLPTGETAAFLLAGDDLEKRFEVQRMFSSEHFFARKRILWLDDVAPGEPLLSGKIIINPEYVELFTLGRVSAPRFSMNFPAERLETAMEWSDLILGELTARQIGEIQSWLRHGDTLLHDWGMHKRVKPGYRALFHGPPGTGKTLTAALLGKHTGREVYRVDLSMVISKFIGETEKNLANLFAKAENKDWILFFDEADALFGKRTNVRDAHDKYANQETAYLLQRIESYNGLVILASNFKSNIDDAFMRRFQSVIHFPMPNTGERLLLWKKSFPEKKVDLNGLNLEYIAQRYELSGASILNIVQFCCLRALSRGDISILESDIREGLSKEFNKEGKIVN